MLNFKTILIKQFIYFTYLQNNQQANNNKYDSPVQPWNDGMKLLSTLKTGTPNFFTMNYCLDGQMLTENC